MQENEIHLPEEIFSQFLETINKIKFSPREVDVMACLYKGRSTKKIALILSIAPKTVYAHIRNVMIKLECSSREGIIDFIEKSNKRNVFQVYYQSLLLKQNFEQLLKKISRDNGQTKPTCELIYSKRKNANLVLIHQIEIHLELAGVKVILLEEENHTGENGVTSFTFPLFVLSFEEETYPLSDWAGTPKLFLDLRKSPNSNSNDHISLRREGDYYLFLLKILAMLLQNHNIDEITAEFKKNCENKTNLEKNLDISDEEHSITPSLTTFFWKIWNNKIAITCLVIIGFFGFVFLASKHNFFDGMFHQKTEPIRSDLIIPNKSSLLDRSDIITKITESLNEQDGINSLALVGIGGAGKTTLARLFARSQNPSVLWEINAENHEILIESFENLAQALAKTEDEKIALRKIQEIKDPQKRESQVLSLVKEKLKSRSNWLLIFDNVENFSDIQNHFPYDPTNWGEGNVILTTRDSNIKNSPHIYQTLQIGELKPDESLRLFVTIMTHGSDQSFTDSQNQEAKKFIEKIPPFPLDISVAANYVKAANLNYVQYLEDINKHTAEFSSVQKHVLNENSPNITKTRYSIVSLSLQQLMDSNEEFFDLLLYVSLLDSQSLSRSLLNAYKKNGVIDVFVHALKKHSLITSEGAGMIEKDESKFSIHRNVQNIILAKLIASLDSGEREKILRPIFLALEHYVLEAIEKEDVNRIKSSLAHVEALSKHLKAYDNHMLGDVIAILGSIHLYLGNYVKAEALLNQSLELQENEYGRYHYKTALTLKNLGVLHRNLINVDKAKSLLEESYKIVKDNFGEDHIELALISRHLGDTYRNLGDYQKAAEYLRAENSYFQNQPDLKNLESIEILVSLGILNKNQGSFLEAKKYLENALSRSKDLRGDNHFKSGRAFLLLAGVYKDLGMYEQARELQQRGLALYETHYGKTHTNTAESLIYLGNIFSNLGDYKQALDYCLRGHTILNEFYGENHVLIGEADLILGKIYTDIGQLKLANDYLNHGLKTFENNYGKNHIRVVEALYKLGKVCIMEEKYELAEQHLLKALSLYSSKDHSEAYIPLELLGELHIKMANEFSESSAENRAKSLTYLHKALELVEKNYNSESPYYNRIQSRIVAVSNKGI